MPDPNYVSEIEREDGTLLTIKDAEARAAIDGMDPTLQQILQGVNDIKNSIGDVGEIVEEILVGPPTLIEKTITENGTYAAEDDNADGYSSVTVDVSGGGGSSGNDVIFYDYDGSVVTSYSAADFANLSTMPENPTHDGFISQGWNWTLDKAKTYVADYGALNIGQMYVTSDGKTRLYISLPEERTSPILQLYLNENSELDIDWGDGSTHSTFTSTTADYKSERHEYVSSSNYVITITVVSGGFELQASSSSILCNGNDDPFSPDMAYSNAIKKIEIGGNVTSIGDMAFFSGFSLSSITIPNGITSIGSTAFGMCSSLSSITIPDSVTSIGETAFYNCTSLSSITIPSGVTSIGGSMAFMNCTSLSSITIPDGVTSIGAGAFNYCTSLSSITIPDGVTSIGNNAFSICASLSSITIPTSVSSIGTSAFGGCFALSSITIPGSVTSIDEGVFASCYALASITIPSSVTSIGRKAFYSCYSLSSITIPDGVTSIGQDAFQECYALASVTIPSSVTSIGAGAFDMCSALSSITIPDSVTSIGEGAFQGCYSLSSITIPSSVTSIGSYAFSDCSYMSFIKFESTTPPTVSSSDAWDNVSTSTKILVPTGTLETYKTATNYPDPSTYTYEEY